MWSRTFVHIRGSAVLMVLRNPTMALAHAPTVPYTGTVRGGPISPPRLTLRMGSSSAKDAGIPHERPFRIVAPLSDFPHIQRPASSYPS